MNATPEQYAAVAEILGLTEIQGSRVKGSAEEVGDVSSVQCSADVARSAFALLQKLELDAPLKAPSVLTVFRLYCVDGHSADRVARKCRCGKATVIRRLRFIEQQTNVRPEDFRAMSGHLQQMDDELRASGAREIYRRGIAGGED